MEIIHYNSIYTDIDGNMVERTIEEYPYNYDSFVVWKKDYNKDKSNTAYSDRLFQQDCCKFNKCCMKVWGNTGQIFDDRSPKDIERFLSMYLNKEIKLTAIMEGCNASGGFPIWIFIYEIEKEIYK